MNVDPHRNVTLHGERELMEHAGHLLTGAREEFVCAAADLRTWAMPGSRERIVAARRASPGAAVHKLFSPRVLDDEESERHLVEVAGRGVRVRICAAALAHETIIIDRRIAILAGPPVRGVRDYTVVRSPDVLNGVISLFWATWQAATDLADFRRAGRFALDEQDRRILRSLGEGLKDEAAARRLGLSLRTYRRRVAELMTELGASSRFQAGARARELGLDA
ncbi:helix-turn-helix transcriptional regulator [Actinomadura sp. HBU206391]|uniref:helix-turn-helix transcriptional regulator n=1 Tax=Actinomadura sp. HBU206391 TaxID=2731692 RepID=UPI00164F5188|nr:helix-turn-helix transcriptional regulator [Actinomadura sp. HBU206391]MBC6456462.1 helix-turn-helix transcriptional regulator [Actinomadura sp. HBU206391]